MRYEHHSSVSEDTVHATHRQQASAGWLNRASRNIARIFKSVGDGLEAQYDYPMGRVQMTGEEVMNQKPPRIQL